MFIRSIWKVAALLLVALLQAFPSYCAVNAVAKPASTISITPSNNCLVSSIKVCIQWDRLRSAPRVLRVTREKASTLIQSSQKVSGNKISCIMFVQVVTKNGYERYLTERKVEAVRCFGRNMQSSGSAIEGIETIQTLLPKTPKEIFHTGFSRLHIALEVKCCEYCQQDWPHNMISCIQWNFCLFGNPVLNQST